MSVRALFTSGFPSGRDYVHNPRTIQGLWDASPPRFSTGAAWEELPGLWVQFTGPASDAGRWDQRRLWAVHPGQFLMTALPGQWFFEGTDAEEEGRDLLPKRLVSCREYAETFAGLLPFMEETQPSPLLSVLAFQLMEAITLPEDTYYCKQCETEFQPALGKNAPRKDHGGCCSDECAAVWKREYDKRLYQQPRKCSLACMNKGAKSALSCIHRAASGTITSVRKECP